MQCYRSGVAPIAAALLMVGLDWFRTAPLRHVIALAFAAAAGMSLLVLLLAGWRLQATLAHGDTPDWLLLAAVSSGILVALLLAIWLLLDRHLHARGARPPRPARAAGILRCRCAQRAHAPGGTGRRAAAAFELRGIRHRDHRPGAFRRRRDRVHRRRAYPRRPRGRCPAVLAAGRPWTTDPAGFDPLSRDHPRHGARRAGHRRCSAGIPGLRGRRGAGAHNAAFDMRFLKLKEDDAGVRIDNLVLDSLLLSVFLDQESRNHDLDAVAERLGVTVDGRHTALVDARVTAHVFLRMLGMLETRGVTTLRQVVSASLGVEHIRRMQRRF